MVDEPKRGSSRGAVYFLRRSLTDPWLWGFTGGAFLLFLLLQHVPSMSAEAYGKFAIAAFLAYAGLLVFRSRQQGETLGRRPERRNGE